jgi:glycosyltransferase involved in cell wall biosynthesis
MKIIIVSWHCPPINTIAAVRVGKLARHLIAAGHEVRIVTVRRPDPDRSLELGLDVALISRTPFLDLDRLLDRRRRPGSAAAAGADAIPPAPTRADRAAGWRRRLSELYRGLVFLPDRQVGWGPSLLRTLTRTIASFGPDLVLASGPPFSSFIWTAIAARRTGVPWIAEFRDRWSEDTYTEIAGWRRPFDAWLERRVVGSAAAIVTVSEPWRELYATKFAKPTISVMNGYDPADLPQAAPPPRGGLPLTLVHVGTIYRGRRDPTALCQALRQGGFTPSEIRLVFYGRHLEWVDEIAHAVGVRDFVELHHPVPYAQALALQTRADLLLLLQWNAPGEAGNVPGKLFEYLAARRPIVGLGPEDGVPARLIRERRAGLFTNDPGALAAWLRERVEEKRRTGMVAALPDAAAAGLTREDQFALLTAFLERRRRTPEQSGMIGSTLRSNPARKSRRAV